MDPLRQWRQGLAAYRQGRYFEAHEHWEDLWRAEPPGERKLCLQALVQLAAGLHKLRSGIRPRGAPALLERAADKLSRVSRPCFGVDPARLLPQVRRLQAEAAEALAKATVLGEGEKPKPAWLADAHRLQGDAMRLGGNKDEAIKHYKRYMDLAPRNAIDREEVTKRLLDMGAAP